MREKLLEVKNLAGGYGEKRVFSDVSFSLFKGEFVSLVGPNASGKTTLLRALLRLLPFLEGEIIWRDISLRRLPRKRTARFMAYVPQENGLDFQFSLEEIVAMGRFPHSPLLGDRKADRGKIQEALSTVGLCGKEKSIYSSLSGGEKRRALIARALAQEGELLLLDEPTLHLDLKYQLEITVLLSQLKQKGLAVLAVYHDIHLARLYADRVLLMKEGRLRGELQGEALSDGVIADLFGLEPHQVAFFKRTF